MYEYVCLCGTRRGERETCVPRLGKGKAEEHENAKCAQQETPPHFYFQVILIYLHTSEASKVCFQGKF